MIQVLLQSCITRKTHKTELQTRKSENPSKMICHIPEALEAQPGISWPTQGKQKLLQITLNYRV